MRVGNRCGHMEGWPQKRFLRLVASAAALCLLAPAVSARAAVTELTAEPGAAYPDVAVDTAGTAHVVWTVKTPGDDHVVYCRVPRGGAACTPAMVLPLPGEATDPDVVISGTGEVIVEANVTGVAFNSRSYVVVSADGGSTFSEPRAISERFYGIGEEVTVGPGDFTLSLVGGFGGANHGLVYQAAPLTTTTTEVADLTGGDWKKSYHPSVAFPDPLTPLVAYSDLDSVYFRRFGGGTAYNDAASWQPEVALGEGDEPRLAGGPRGVYLLDSDDATPRQYRVRRYDGTNFGPAAVVSDPKLGEAIFRDFVEDGGGTLHAVFLQRPRTGGEWQLRHRTSRDGERWDSTAVLATQSQGTEFFNLRVAAGPDAGGVVVSDANGQGPIRLVPFGPGGSGGGATCAPTVKVGKTVIFARDGCFTRKGDRWTAAGDLRVNGIDLLAGAGKETVVVDTGDRTLRTAGKVEARVGNVVLGSQTVEWRLPNGIGEIHDLAGNPAKFNTAKQGLLGLPVSGYTVPRVVGDGRAAIDVNVGLPEPFDGLLGGGASASTTLHANNAQGLEVTGLKLQVQNASIGIAGLGSFQLEFVEGTSTLRGTANLLFPVVNSPLQVTFQLTNGQFDYGHGEFGPIVPGIPVATNVFLREITFDVQKGAGCEKPTQIGGGALFVTGQPEILGRPLIAVDGNITYSFPRSTCGKPGVLDIRGDGSLVGIDVATAGARFTTDWTLTFDANVGFNATAASASVDMAGGIDIDKKQFYASATASAKIADVTLASFDAIVSSVGIAGCGTVVPLPSPGSLIEGDPEPIEAGFEYPWGGSFDPDWPDSCDVNLGAYKPSAFQSAHGSGAGARAARSTSFSLPRGLSEAELRLGGDGAAPGVALTGPGGLRVDYPAGSVTRMQKSGVQIVSLAHLGRTQVRLVHPRAGRYTVEDAVGAPPLTSVEVARGLPAPSVRGRLRRVRGGRMLAFQARPIPGQLLRFFEQGGGVLKALGTTSRSRGSLRFRPADGPGGRRTIVAVVEQSGAPRARIALAHYRARSARPSRVRGLRVRRRANNLLISWRRVAGARRYAVGWRLLDGRRGAKLTTRRQLVLRGFPGIDSGTIRVAGVRRDNVAGPVAKTNVRAKPKKPPHRKRRR